MKRVARWLMGWFSRSDDPPAREQRPSEPPIDRAALREQMTRDDPDFRRVRDAQHDAIQILTAKGLRDGMALRHEREFWERNRGT